MCYCGRETNYENCCGRFLDANEVPNHAEELMRSRYSAYVLKKFAYLAATHDPQTSSPKLNEANQEWGSNVEFVGLEIIRAEESEKKARVEFIAKYRQLPGSNELKHHELSEFRKQGGRWYFRKSLRVLI